jgi:nicotinamide riboside transporter PnuC
MNEWIGAVAGLLAVSGVVLNNRRMIGCFPIWMMSNATSCMLHLQAGMISLALRDAVFFCLAIEGWWRWRRKAAR